MIGNTKTKHKKIFILPFLLHQTTAGDRPCSHQRPPNLPVQLRSPSRCKLAVFLSRVFLGSDDYYSFRLDPTRRPSFF